MRLLILLSLILVTLSGCTPALQSSPVPSPEVVVPEPTLEPTAQLEPTSSPPPSSSPPPEGPIGWIAFTSAEGNISLLHPASGNRQQVTSDALPLGPGTASHTIAYCCSKWSSDGMYLAFQREVGIQHQEGYKFEFSLWVYEAATGIVRQLIENQRVIGFAWQPGTVNIAFGVEADGNYFASRSGPSPEYAQGIWVINAINGDKTELIPPQQGYWIVNPQWSPSGRYISFEEVQAMEGRGRFAYYDFENQQYSSWGRSIGFYSWYPLEDMIAYDTLTYHPNGTERIWISKSDGSEEKPFSPDTGTGYAFFPSYSPTEDTIAYFQEVNGPESGQYHLYLQPVGGAEPRNLGLFTQVDNLSWAPDGKYLIFTAGPYEGRELVMINLSNETAEALAKGSQPVWQPSVDSSSN
jgi:WD40 repeat protein